MQMSMIKKSLPAALALVLYGLPIYGQGQGVQLIPVDRIISQPGHYVLTNDLSTTGPGAAITITAKGVTLDLNGHEVRGPGGQVGTGIEISGAQGVEVTNGRLAYFAIGVRVANSANVVLQGLQIRGQGLAVSAPPPEVGIMIAQSKNVCVEKNAIYNVGLGVFVRGSQSWGNRIGNNTITANTNGVFGICYNPTETDPEGPRGDLIHDNLITGYNVGINVREVAVYNVFKGNTIAYMTAAMELMSDTNQDIDNIGVPLP